MGMVKIWLFLIQVSYPPRRRKRKEELRHKCENVMTNSFIVTVFTPLLAILQLPPGPALPLGNCLRPPKSQNFRKEPGSRGKINKKIKKQKFW